MRAPTRPGRSALALRLAAGLASTGGVCLAASLLTAYLLADHSSPDSSASSLTATGLGGAGLLLGLLLIGGGLGRLWRRARRAR